MSESASSGWLLALAAACSLGCGQTGPADAGTQDSATLDGALDGCATDRFAWGRGGDLMLPGADCLECHVEDGAAADFPFTVAGTVFAAADCPEGAEAAFVDTLIPGAHRDPTGAPGGIDANVPGLFD